MSPFLGDLLGTMMLIILGDGVVAAVLLNKSKAQNSGWIVITTGWAFAVMVGVFTAQAFGSAGAHINPAVTVAFLITGGVTADQLPLYWGGQFLGAFLGGGLVWLKYLPDWAETRRQGFKTPGVC